MHWLEATSYVAGSVLAVLTIGGILRVGIKRSVTRRRERHEALQRRNWEGYIDLGGIGTWYVRLTEEPTEPTATVMLEVVDSKGEPHPNGAYEMRNGVRADGQLSRSPTPEQLDFLKHRMERGYPKRINVR